MWRVPIDRFVLLAGNSAYPWKKLPNWLTKLFTNLLWLTGTSATPASAGEQGDQARGAGSHA